ncbi:MAG: CbtB domain-containing protein [Sneathiella sp.]
MQHTASAQKNLSFGLSTKVQILSAMTLGVGLFLFVGFAPVSAVHNAAHDVRHAFAFPCH